MIAEALKFLTDIGHKASGLHKLPLPDGELLVVLPDGRAETYEARILDRRDKLLTLDSLIQWVALRPAAAEVFVGETSVVAVNYLDTAPTINEASFGLLHSPAWTCLEDWIGHSRTQQEVIRMLRGPLHGCCSAGLLGVFRSIEFRNEMKSERTIKTSADSMRRSARREAMSGGQELPEELVFQVQVFDIQDSPTLSVPVAVDVDYEAERIRLIQIGNSIEEAALAARRWIVAQFVEQTEAKVFHGSYSRI